MSELYRLVYTSRNLLTGTEAARAAAVAAILATSQANNARVGVSGALLFNGGSFAQVLEGPRPVVEATFERIQRDPRHSDVSVLQCEAVHERGFPNWSMAFVGHSARGRALWNELAERTGFDLARIEGEDLFATLRTIVLAEEGLTDGDAPGRPIAAPETGSGGAWSGGEMLDVERLRAELRDVMPEERQPAAISSSSGAAGSGEAVETSDAMTSGSESAVLRGALAAERERTTELRRTLDDMRIALAAAEHEMARLRQQRDVLAHRAKTLALAFIEDVSPVSAARPQPSSTRIKSMGDGQRAIKAAAG